MDSASASASRTPNRNREIALQHANIIQHRKDVELRILTSTETLLDLPLNPQADPANPQPQDVFQVKAALHDFQPFDYDSLIEERNINGKCGYVFCPHAHRQEDTKAKFRIVPDRGTSKDVVKVVERHLLEQWCSKECGKRALYVRVQLSEEPAWCRTEDVGGLRLLGEVDGVGFEKGGGDIVDGMKDLTLERGDGRDHGRMSRLVDVALREREHAGRLAGLPVMEDSEHRVRSAGVLEGYASRFSGGKISQL